MRKNYKTSITVFVTVFLGAIGSGIWQYILEPALKDSTNFMLELATLGVESFKNDLYVEISRGYQELASHRIQSLFSTLIASVFILASIGLVFKVRKLIEDLENLEAGEEPKSNNLSAEEIKNRLESNNPKKTLKLTYFTAVLSGVFSVMLIVSTFSYEYINSAVTHYYQVKRIAAPYVTLPERLEIESQFSQISSSDDYRILIERLYDVLAESGQEVRVVKFNVW
jgi:hypothetical protein